jgi:hypothetical protein
MLLGHHHLGPKATRAIAKIGNTIPADDQTSSKENVRTSRTTFMRYHQLVVTLSPRPAVKLLNTWVALSPAVENSAPP